MNGARSQAKCGFSTGDIIRCQLIGGAVRFWKLPSAVVFLKSEADQKARLSGEAKESAEQVVYIGALAQHQQTVSSEQPPPTTLISVDTWVTVEVARAVLAVPGRTRRAARALSRGYVGWAPELL